MEKTIYKYELETTDSQTIEIPSGKIISVQMQKDKLCLWALVNPEMDKQKRLIEIYGTVNPIKEIEGTTLYHRGTYQLNDGELVFHVFERI